MHATDHEEPFPPPRPNATDAAAAVEPDESSTDIFADMPSSFRFDDVVAAASPRTTSGAAPEVGDDDDDRTFESEFGELEVVASEPGHGTASAEASGVAEVEVRAELTEPWAVPRASASPAPGDAGAGAAAVAFAASDAPTMATAPSTSLREHAWPVALVWRCASIYSLLFCLPFPVNLLPWTQAWAARWVSGEQALVAWLAERVLGIVPTLPTVGGGDTMFDWLRAMFAAVAALALGGLWHLLRRRRRPGARLRDVARTYLRYFVAGTLLGYGANKAIPLQFGQLDADLLSTPLGQLEPTSMLWTFMASSPVYTSFVGCIEVIAGLMLLWRNTSLLGALLALGILANVTMLGFCFDVPHKLLSLHLLAFALLLCARDAHRLLELFLHNRAVAPAVLWPWWRTAWLRRPLKLVKIAFVGWLLFSNVRDDFDQWQARNAALPPLAGVYAIETLSLAGAEVPAFTSPQRWVRLYVRRDGSTVVTATDGTRLRYRGEVDQDAKVLHLRPEPGSGAPAAELRFAQPDAGHVDFDGSIGGAPLRLSCRRLEVEGFALARRAFEWVERR